jgi:uncharacterized membrane protein
MTNVPAPLPRTPWRQGLRLLVIGLAVAVGVVLVAVGGQHPVAQWQSYFNSLHIHPHAPDLSLVAAAPWQIKLHLTAALLALGIGIVQMVGIKGNALHKVLGWTWVVVMGTTAVSSFFIRELNHGSLSLIHLLSGWTIIALPMAIVAIRRGKVAMHARLMMGLFLGGLIIAGLLTFIPGRLMWQVFFG